MWSYRLASPGQLERIDVPEPDPDDLGPGHVLARFRAGSICGSDLPSFLGRKNPLVDTHGAPGYPLHEVVGDVVASRADEVPVGARIVGWSDRMAGLSEVFRAPADAVLVLPGEADPVRSTVVQPLCTVLYTLDRIGAIAGRRAAVIGQGTLGILFSHVLHDRGAASVTGVDRVDRSDVAAAFGVDDPVWDTSDGWARSLPQLRGEHRPDVVVEAVGHQTGTIADAVAALAPGGTIVAFGVPDDSHYGFPFETFFRKNAVLLGGVAKDRARSLARAREYLTAHPQLAEDYITHVFPVDAAQRAFETAARPARGRLKVAIVGSA